MKIITALITGVFILAGAAAQAQQPTISWELERGFRFFKYNSDFEFQRLAFRHFQETHEGKIPDVAQLDAMLNNLGWQYRAVPPKLAAWYGHTSAITPINLLREWRRDERAQGRPRGYLELADRLKAANMQDWEYHPARLGWGSLLFPSHQTGDEIGTGKLTAASEVAVCWDRANQFHTNCDASDPYIKPKQHTVSLRAIDSAGVRINAGPCTWEIGGAPDAHFVSPAITGKTLDTSCGTKVVLSIPYPNETTVKLNFGGAETPPVTIKVEDALVVGFGDSFSSGEGNPDVPAKLAWTSDRQRDPVASPGDIADTVTRGPTRKAAGDYFAAQWIDRSCHRSVYNYQIRSALHLALAEPHRAITYLGYACSGAEVNEGLFQPFQGPEYTNNKAKLAPWHRAQISLFLNELCEKYDGDGVKPKPLAAAEEANVKAYRFGGLISDTAYRCNEKTLKRGFKRPVDLMYVSIGGNDMGFSSWLFAAITSEGNLGSFFPILKEDSPSECAAHSTSCAKTEGRWRRLQSRYRLLRDFIDNRVSFVDRGVSPVLLYTYPLPARASAEAPCPAGNAGLGIFANRFGSPEPKVCLTEKQGNLPVLKTIADFADRKLNNEIKNLAKDKDSAGNVRPAWTAVSAYGPTFTNRGYCASNVRAASGNVAPAEPTAGCLSAAKIWSLVTANNPLSDAAAQESLHLPVVKEEQWYPFDPVFAYLPYAHRTRLLRTMNETYFVINQLTGATQAVKASGILSLKDAAVYGAFHPTAEAHTIVAQDFFKESKAILEKAVKGQ